MFKRFSRLFVGLAILAVGSLGLAVAEPWDGLPLPKEAKKALHDANKAIPDQDGNGMDRGVEEITETAEGIVFGDKPPIGDSNNGCGNEPPYEIPPEDDNNGWCGKPKLPDDVEDAVDDVVDDVGDALDPVQDPVEEVVDENCFLLGTELICDLGDEAGDVIFF